MSDKGFCCQGQGFVQVEVATCYRAAIDMRIALPASSPSLYQDAIVRRFSNLLSLLIMALKAAQHLRLPLKHTHIIPVSCTHYLNTGLSKRVHAV